jgi:hypothetical protein
LPPLLSRGIRPRTNRDPYLRGSGLDLRGCGECVYFLRWREEFAGNAVLGAGGRGFGPKRALRWCLDLLHGPHVALLPPLPAPLGTDDAAWPRFHSRLRRRGRTQDPVYCYNVYPLVYEEG